MSSTKIIVREAKRRARISPGKRGMLETVIRIVFALERYWPLSDRSIHYEVLNDPPLRHLAKPQSRYVNNRSCYSDLTNLLTRARLTGEIPFEAIADPTRKVVCWRGYNDINGFARKELDGFLVGFRRDRQENQPHHLEIIGEKNTVESSIRSVAYEYGIPYTLGRGYCSLDPRKQMLDRFKRSGKAKLALLVLSDFDPDGTIIAASFTRSMRDDFGIDLDDMVPLKVCLNWDQVRERKLPAEFDIPPKKMRLAKFQDHAAKYGNHFHELEALSHEERSNLLREAIHEVLDRDAFDATMTLEREQQARIDEARPKLRKNVLRTMSRLGLE